MDKTLKCVGVCQDKNLDFPDHIFASSGTYILVSRCLDGSLCVVAKTAFWCSFFFFFGQIICLCSGLQKDGAGCGGKVSGPIPLQRSWRHPQCFADWVWGGWSSLGPLSQGEEHTEALCRDLTMPQHFWLCKRRGPLLPFSPGGF